MGLWMWMEEIVVGIIALVALGVLLFAVRASKSTDAAQSLAGRVASIFAAGGVATFWWSRWWAPFQEDPEARYAIPIAAATVAVAVYALVGSRRTDPQPLGAVDLSPRSVWSYGSRSWFAGWWTLTGLMAGTVLLAGLASSTDEHGRHTMIFIQMGSANAGTTFFGWWFGIPVLVALAVLILVVQLALWRIARPAAPANPVQRERDRGDRRNRTRTVLSIAAGAVAFTLGVSWNFLGRSSQLAGGLSAPDGVPIEVGTSFAALAVPLTVLGILLEGLGVALLLLALFQPRRRASLPVAAEQPEVVAPGMR
ncbi:hypothetical protein LQ757_05980 [Agromyces sp. SYSU K20354]|uniref:hypothetical protein n=1 Tax=Agromyces cavernae TaxID=2898659 RepID=UPI001E32AEF4|nr:hypothetical protein [Agromyces cavernae]MCD2441825.1 hypothetical protein [Agromyces cavernae]